MDFYQYDKMIQPIEHATMMSEIRKCAISVILEYGFIGADTITDIVIDKLGIEGMETHGKTTFFYIKDLVIQAKNNYSQDRSGYINPNGQIKLLF